MIFLNLTWINTLSFTNLYISISIFYVSLFRYASSHAWYDCRGLGLLRLLLLLIFYMLCGPCFSCGFCCYYCVMCCVAIICGDYDSWIIHNNSENNCCHIIPLCVIFSFIVIYIICLELLIVTDFWSIFLY